MNVHDAWREFVAVADGPYELAIPAFLRWKLALAEAELIEAGEPARVMLRAEARLRAERVEGRSIAAADRMARNAATASRIASAFAAILGETPRQLPALLGAYWPVQDRKPGRVKDFANLIRIEPVPAARAHALRLAAARYFPGASSAAHFVKGVPGAAHTMPLPDRIAAMRDAINGE